MTLRLILSRHAKSDWDNPLDTDHQRPLNPRGKRAAPLIGRWLVYKSYLPQQTLVSDAARTRETWALMSAEFPAFVQAEFTSALYLASPDVMLRELRHATAPSVLMLGHNPGIAEFAAMLLRLPFTDPDFQRFPTGATLIAEFDANSWADLRCHTGSCVDFITPRRLDGTAA